MMEMTAELPWAESVHFPVLALLQLLPLLGAGLVYALRNTNYAALLARVVTALVLWLAVFLYLNLDAVRPGMQLVERLDLPGGLNYHTGADGMTTLFVLATALIMFMISLYTLVRGLMDTARLLVAILLIEAVMMSALCTLNLLWFVLATAFEVGLVGYIVWHWATSLDKDLAMRRFYQFHGTGLLLLFAGTLLAGMSYAAVTGLPASYELEALATVIDQAPLATMVFALLCMGLAVRAPLFPFHGWLPTIAHHGSVAVAPACLLGVKLSIYGLVRFILPLFPQHALDARPFVLALSLAGIFYAATLAFQQNNLRRLLAFSVISHTSLLVLGVFTFDAAALQGSVLLAVTFGLSATTLFFVVGLIYRRTGSTNLARLGGLFDRLPMLALAFLISGLAIVCMPGTPGFDAAHLVFEGAIHHFGALPTVAAALGNVVAAGFLLWAFQRAFLAVREKPLGDIDRETGVEMFVAGALLALLMVAGFHMQPWLDLVATPMHELGARLAVAP